MNQQKKYNKKKKIIKANIKDFDFVSKKFVAKKTNELYDLNAIIYCRVSSQGQVQYGHGIETQEKICRERCQHNGINLIKVFKDEGISGSLLNRQGLNNAMNFLETENGKYTKIKYFVCTEASRISRSDELIDTLDIDARIRSNGVDIIYVMQPIDTSTDEGQLIKYIQYVYANYERKKIAKRTINALRGRILQGFRPFPNLPAGYYWNGSGKEKGIFLDQEKAKILKLGYENYLNGIFLNKIQMVEFFIENGVKKLSKKQKIYNSYISQFFNPLTLYFYAGYVIFPQRDINEPIQGHHKPIFGIDILYGILEKEINSNVKKIKEIKISKNTFNENYQLKGLVICNSCGRKFTGRGSKGRSGQLFYYYGCQNKHCEEKPNIPVEKLHGEIKNYLEKIKPSDQIVELFKIIFKKCFQEKEKIFSNKINIKKKRLSDLKNELEQIENSLTKLDNPNILNKLQEKRSLLNEEKNILEYEIKSFNQDDLFQDIFDKVITIFKNPVLIWDLGNYELKQLLLEVRFGGKIYYKKSEGVRTDENNVMIRLLTDIKANNSKWWVI